jgi:heme-degrading monooxygenase HmoA
LEVLVFAHVISAQTTADHVNNAIEIAKQQLPGARSQQGYQGFYVLADRASGKLMTISLWESHEDLLAVEARAAHMRAEAAQSLATAAPPVDIYQVEIADQAR